MLEIEHWSQRAFSAVLSLWSSAELRAWRNSVDKAEANREYRPTVSFNVLVTLAEFGAFSEPYLSGLPGIDVRVDDAIRSIGRPGDHLTETSHRAGPRQLIFLSHFVSALRALATHAHGARTHTRIRSAAADATVRFVRTFAVYGDGAQLPARLLESPYLSPFLLLYARTFIVDQAAIRMIVGGTRPAGLARI